MNINRLIEQKRRIKTLLLIVSTFSLFSCQPLPKNIGVSLSTSEIGIVYTAKVKAIYPIFVETFSNHSYADGVGETASAIVEDVFKGSSRVFQYSSIISSFARTGTGIYEERYAGFYCHYILEVSDQSLIEDIKDSGNVYDDFDDDSDFDDSNFDDSNFGNDDFESFDDVNHHKTKVTPVEFDESSGFALASSSDDETDTNFDENTEAEKSVSEVFEAQLAKLVAMNLKKEKKIQQLLQKQKDIPKVFVVNPCRDFEINEMVTVSKSDNTVILQPNFLENLTL